MFPSLFRASTSFAFKEKPLSASLAGGRSRKQISENVLGAIICISHGNFEMIKPRGDVNIEITTPKRVNMAI